MHTHTHPHILRHTETCIPSCILFLPSVSTFQFSFSPHNPPLPISLLFNPALFFLFRFPSFLALVRMLSSFSGLPRYCLTLFLPVFLPLMWYLVPETCFAASRRSYWAILREPYPHWQLSENYFCRHFRERLSGCPDLRPAVYLQRHTRLCASVQIWEQRRGLVAHDGRQILRPSEGISKVLKQDVFFLMHSQVGVSTE